MDVVFGREAGVAVEGQAFAEHGTCGIERGLGLILASLMERTENGTIKVTAKQIASASVLWKRTVSGP